MPDGQRRGIVLAISTQVQDQLGGHGRVLPGDEAAGLLPSGLLPAGDTPDLVILPPAGGPDTPGEPGDSGRGGGPLAVLDVAPRAPRDAAAVHRHRALAGAGVPLYVVVDPAEEVCTVHSRPLPDGGYREAERVPFGNDVFLPLADRTLVLRTDGLPADPG
ncbi:hypothetical protein ACWGB8_04935 [Kitasatospora sp. NPDC054939]